MTTQAVYPVRTDATLDAPLSRWLWLVKWVLAVPHYLVLAFLWVGFVVLSVGAFFAILFTGRYPRAVFDFNVGVLRWTWRVQFYTYGALATDRYPPFTLAEVDDYPAHLHVDYPGRLSRGLVLVKWWLLALPHYLIVGLFIGGGTWVAWRFGSAEFNWAAGGLIGVLVVIAGVILLFTGRYPQPLFDFVLGLNRWVLRVAAYAGLMTDDYPPFRFDGGAHEPSAVATAPTPHPPASYDEGQRRDDTLSYDEGPRAEDPYSPEGPPPDRRGGWTGRRVVAVVAGAVLSLTSTGLLLAAGVLLWLDGPQRGGDGYVDLGTRTLASDGVAVVSDPMELRGGDADWAVVHAVVGTVRLQAESDRPVFVGIAPAADVDTFLAGAAYGVVDDWGRARVDESPGGTAVAAPATAGIWVESAAGAGLQELRWEGEDGTWRAVVMNADGSPGVSAQVAAAATLPALGWIAGACAVVALVLLAVAVPLIVVAVRRAGAATGG